MTAVLERPPTPPQAVQTKTLPDQLDALTALRFFAAASVVFCHTSGILLQVSFDSNIAFSHSVSFFFVLSGFILTYVHPSVVGKEQVKHFWRARFARIYPAHAFALMVTLCFAPWSHIKANALQLVSNIFLVHDWIPHYTFFQCYDLPSWSVSDEIFFYLMFPLVILNLRKTWWLKLGGAFLLAMATIAAPWVFKMPTDGLNGLTVFGMYYFFPPARLFEFVLGMCTALVWHHVREHKTKLNAPVATALELTTLAAFLWFGTNTYNVLRPLLTNPHMFFQGLGTWLTVTGNCFTFAAMILIFATERGLVARFAKWKPFVWLGELSYSTYLLHYPIMLGILQLKLKYHLNPVATVALMIGITYPASALTYHFLEMPMRRFIVGKKKKQQSTSAAEPVREPAGVA